MKTYPLLQSQMGIVMAWSKSPCSTAYNLPSAIPYSQDIDPERLAEAVRTVIKARPVLRLRLVKDDKGQVRQFIDEGMRMPVVVRTAREEEVQHYIRHGFVRPFHLFGDEPLCRFEIIATEEHCWLLNDFHHVIADGITIAYLFVGKDLQEAYRGETLSGSNDSDSEKIFLEAIAEQESFGGTPYRQAKQFYLSKYQDVELTRLPLTTGNAPASHDAAVVEHTFVDREEIDHFCAAHHLRQHAFFMTVFNVALAKFCHTNHLAYATLVHGRPGKKFYDAYGMFVKTIPVACDVNPDDSIENAVNHIQRELLQAMRHTAYPFTHFCHDMQAAPGITFAFQGDSILEHVALDGKATKGIQLDKGRMDGELSCVIYCQDKEYEIRTEACHGRHLPHWSHLMSQAMKNGVEYILRHPQTRMGDIDIVSDEEKSAIISISEGEKMVVDVGKTWIDLFLQKVDEAPDALAVNDGITSLSYKELDEWSSAIASDLDGDKEQAGDFVGVETTPCTAFLASVLAVMRTGRAYVPIDPLWPEQHKNMILEDARIQKLIRPQSLVFQRHHAHLECINKAAPSMPAYVIYTSGTTQRARGVVVSHRALLNLACFITRQWGLTPASRISCHSSLAFDASVEDLFPVLTVGGTVFIMPESVRKSPEAIHHFIDKYGITGGCYTTSLAPLLANRPHPTLEYVCLGGEKLFHHPRMNCHIYNTYGPTEFTVDATFHELRDDEEGDIPIGRPLHNNAAFVADHLGMLLPIGAVGELCLTGPQIAEGYLNVPELTEEKFTNARFALGKVYHTGDLARWDEDARLHYVTRLDGLVKVGGFRVATIEVERHVSSLEHIQQVAVCAMEMGGRKVLCAFFTADKDFSSGEGTHADAHGLHPRIADLNSALADRCPAYMIPAFFIQIDHMPLTANGKVDFKLLGTIQPAKEAQMQPPENEMEKMFCHIFAHVLGLEEFGATDDFFLMGGTSISVMYVMAEAEKAGLQLDYGDMFKHPTPRALARKTEHVLREENHDIAEYDYASIHRFLHAQDENGNGSACQDANGRILLTGATGFLGAHVLRQLLNSDNNICCMVRAASEQMAWERLEETWSYYFDQHLTASEREKLEVIWGDLTDPLFWQDLDNMEMGLVMHCAADVRHFAHKETLFEVNTKATGLLADYCVKHHTRLVHVSTLSVAGVSQTGKPMTLSDQQLYVGQQFHEQYSLSKFLAERLLLEKMANQGLSALIVRIGNLAPRLSDGRFQRNAEANGIATALRMMTEQNVMPQSAETLEIDVSPVDVVAEHLTRLACESHKSGVCHIAHAHPGGLPDMLKKMTDTPPRVVEDEEFKKLMRQWCQTHGIAPFIYI